VLREVPREQMASEPMRKKVRVTDPDGRTVALRWARFSADSLVGSTATGGPSEDLAADPGLVRMRLEGIARLQQRQVDWFRTSLLAGAAAGAGWLYVLSQDEEEQPPDEGPGKVP
jgi:hypothetical protein